MRKTANTASALFAVLAAACTEPATVPTLTWFQNPDNGAGREIAERCSRASGGKYRITVSILPRDASAQREELVRRLAARDASIDLMSVDPPFLAELAAARFLRPFTETEAAELTRGVLPGPIAASRWVGETFGAPLWANTQLLWFRKSAARRASFRPGDHATWDRLISAAGESGSTLEVQGRRYEGYMVWINALVASAGGEILSHPEAGREAVPGIDSPQGREAARIIAELAHSPARDPELSTADEEVGRRVFQSERGGFMLNWPYVHAAAESAVADGSLDRAVFDDIGWARYPRVDERHPSRPPLGGIVLSVSAYSRHPDLAVDAIRCIASAENQKRYMIREKLPASLGAIYDDPEVRAVFPMADLVRDSIATAAPRPITPFYTDVSSATVRCFHPPSAVDETRTPAEAARLVVDVLHDRVLL